ncbi:homocysteine S-methyltransferase 1 isoform X1 [Microcaecilia unicolor]|uniref:Homocysteine S-methyltransferase 1-like isoform X1 n=1 Tax=Microcaecilia unicolor TaxID=1415580 RepID=A0A6P7XXC6_9AMPH|nr:homocysteine S-methyltransferase 1-like isoform X1 [Microcaecilia unicolor]
MEDVKILDGGLSTELEAAGFLIQGDPLWSARMLHTNPQAIKDIHLRFLQSGAEVITTATYQASVEGFCRYLGLQTEEAAELLQLGVKLAKEAAEEFSFQSSEKKRILIAGSVGPYGAFLHDASEYTGHYVDTMSLEELKAWHRQQIRCLESAGVDLIAMETIPSQKEAEALVELLREFPNTKAWLSYSCQDEQHTSHGENFEEAVKVATKSKQLVALGLNCCPPNVVSPLLTSANKNKCLDIEWIIYPNSGEVWDIHAGWKGCSIERPLAVWALEWIHLGAKWIGGCCRTTPSDIADLQQMLRQKQAAN